MAKAKHQILLVEDNALGQKHLDQILAPLNINLTIVNNCQEAVRSHLQTQNVDLVIIDGDVPHLKLNEFRRNLQRVGKSPIPFVMLSSLEAEDALVKSFKVGATACITKSEVSKRLDKVVKKILHRASFCQQRSILVVDDSPLVRRYVETGLRQNSFQVTTVENGRDALVTLSTSRPDLILSDIDMPVMNGFALCKKIQDSPELATIPFVVMSSHGERSHLQHMINLGAAAYLVKPFTADELTCLVERILSDQFRMLEKEKEHIEAEHRSVLSTITSLVSALEARDPYTRGHSESVAKIVSGMLAFAGGSEKERKKIYLAGCLHDIGKIGIRDNLLLKPGKLTPKEFATIKKHPSIGVKILAPIKSLADLLPLVLQHHERFDGKGYPSQVKGKDFNYWASLAAVADTFDALTSNRPYRHGMAEDKALQIIEDARGSQLCPYAVDIFFGWFAENKNKGET